MISKNICDILKLLTLALIFILGCKNPSTNNEDNCKGNSDLSHIIGSKKSCLDFEIEIVDIFDPSDFDSSNFKFGNETLLPPIKIFTINISSISNPKYIQIYVNLSYGSEVDNQETLIYMESAPIYVQAPINNLPVFPTDSTYIQYDTSMPPNIVGISFSINERIIDDSIFTCFTECGCPLGWYTYTIIIYKGDNYDDLSLCAITEYSIQYE